MWVCVQCEFSCIQVAKELLLYQFITVNHCDITNQLHLIAVIAVLMHQSLFEDTNHCE